jgi:quinol monooxygenase YgiN
VLPPDLPLWIPLALGTVAVLGGVSMLIAHIVERRRPLEEIRNGCRTEYGPLELRIQATEGANGFTVFVEDHRREKFYVSEEAWQSTLEAAKEHLTKKAGEYLASIEDSAHYAADWRCS